MLYFVDSVTLPTINEFLCSKRPISPPNFNISFEIHACTIAHVFKTSSHFLVAVMFTKCVRVGLWAKLPPTAHIQTHTYPLNLKSSPIHSQVPA